MYQFLAAPATAWLLAQLIKFSAAALKGDINFTWFWRSGGMPSAHSSTVTALTVVIGFFLGFGSPFFAITTTFAAVVIYDSVGVRQAVGNHSTLLSRLLTKEKDPTVVKHVLGHTGLEVGAGILLGIIVALAYSSSRLSAISEFITTPLGGIEFTVAWIVTGVVLIGAIAHNVFFLRKTKSQTYKRLKRTVFYSIVLPSLFATLFIVFAQQNVTVFSWRVWVWLTLVLVAVLQVVFSIRFYSKIPLLVKEEGKLGNLKRFSKRKKRK